MYAKWVRCIDVNKRAGPRYWVRGFGSLRDMAPLLPHLRELSFSTNVPSWTATACDHLFMLFLADSLTSIVMSGLSGKSTPWLNFSAAAISLRYVSRFAATLSRLDFYVRRPTSNAAWPELVDALALATRLLELGLGCDQLDSEVLATVGGLPTLETLKVLGHAGSAHGVANLRVPADSFPVLRHLQLLDLTATQMGSALAVQPLTANLHSVKLEFRGGGENAFEHSEVLAALAQRCPRLGALTCTFPGGTPSQIQHESVSPIFRVPLREVSFENVRLAGQRDCALLHELWPEATRLSWREQPATLDDLRAFAARPRLQVLGVSLRGLAVPSRIGPYIMEAGDHGPAMLRLESDYSLHHLSVQRVLNLSW